MSKIAVDRALAGAIGFRITARRESLGMSQRGLAGLAGCTGAAISFAEQGLSLPGARIILSLCRVLRMSPNELLGWGETVEAAEPETGVATR